jgi:hypothetical protein
MIDSSRLISIEILPGDIIYLQARIGIGGPHFPRGGDENTAIPLLDSTALVHMERVGLVLIVIHAKVLLIGECNGDQIGAFQQWQAIDHVVYVACPFDRVNIESTKDCVGTTDMKAAEMM